MTGISINGKFLGSALNGVHRTAAMFSDALLSRRAEGHDIEIVVPKEIDASELGAFEPRVVSGSLGTGQAWEMFTLPRATRGRLLVNFCNLGPILHSNSVVMIHDAQTFLYPKDYTGRQAVAYRMLLPMIGKRARMVLTVSEFAKQSLADCGVASENQIEVVYNGADHLKAVTADNRRLASSGLESNSFALTLGSTKSYKNLQLLFEVFQRPEFSDLPLVIAGGPPDSAYQQFGTKPPPNAKFLGPVSDAELKALYQSAEMFLFPSLTEGFGLPPIEAMSCDCPVIAAAAGAMPEVCRDGALLVDPADPDQWAAAISRFRSPHATKQFVSAAAERANHFTWERAGDRLWEVLSWLSE